MVSVVLELDAVATDVCRRRTGDREQMLQELTAEILEITEEIQAGWNRHERRHPAPAAPAQKLTSITTAYIARARIRNATFSPVL